MVATVPLAARLPGAGSAAGRDVGSTAGSTACRLDGSASAPSTAACRLVLIVVDGIIGAGGSAPSGRTAVSLALRSSPSAFDQPRSPMTSSGASAGASVRVERTSHTAVSTIATPSASRSTTSTSVVDPVEPASPATGEVPATATAPPIIAGSRPVAHFDHHVRPALDARRHRRVRRAPLPRVPHRAALGRQGRPALLDDVRAHRSPRQRRRSPARGARRVPARWRAPAVAAQPLAHDEGRLAHPGQVTSATTRQGRCTSCPPCRPTPTATCSPCACRPSSRLVVMLDALTPDVDPNDPRAVSVPTPDPRSRRWARRSDRG